MPQGTNSRIFNPDTMAKPTAGYSQVAVVTGGNLVYIAGQVALDPSAILWATMISEPRSSRSSKI
jgi:enamine deaminase RidA (YjgF/YER057c/UK114 family)